MRRFCFVVLIVLLLSTGCNDDAENENLYKDEIIYLKNEVAKLVEKNEELEDTIVKLNNDISRLYDYSHSFIHADVEISQLYRYLQALPSYTAVFGIIKDYDITNNVIYFDDLEWISSQDKVRIKELGREGESFPNGCFLHNEEEDIIPYTIKERIGFYLLNEEQIVEKSSYETFVEKIGKHSVLCNITFCGEEIVYITEVYFP